MVHFLPWNVVSSNSACEDNICMMLNEALERAKSSIEMYHPESVKGVRQNEHLWFDARRNTGIENHMVWVNFSVSGKEQHLTLKTNESYELTVSTEGSTTNVVIKAPTYFGARHALETLTQLVAYDEEEWALQMVSQAKIKDAPAFAHRGLVIDTSRNFLPLKKLKQILDAMSYSKLNTFHWHITDTQSFPLEIDTYPQLTEYGAYSAKK